MFSPHLRRAARAVLGAFLPASITVLGLVLAAKIVGDPGSVGWGTLALAARQWLMLSAGYGVTLLWLPTRRGRRSTTKLHHAIAGIMAPLTLLGLSIAVQRPGLAGIVVLSFAGGSLTGILQWILARRLPASPPPTLEELEAAADEALVRALNEGSPGVVIPIRRREHTQDRPDAHVA
jgi:hypothetical protein